MERRRENSCFYQEPSSGNISFLAMWISLLSSECLSRWQACVNQRLTVTKYLTVDLDEGKIYFGSHFWNLQPMVSWPTIWGAVVGLHVVWEYVTARQWKRGRRGAGSQCPLQGHTLIDLNFFHQAPSPEGTISWQYCHRVFVGVGGMLHPNCSKLSCMPRWHLYSTVVKFGARVTHLSHS